MKNQQPKVYIKFAEWRWLDGVARGDPARVEQLFGPDRYSGLLSQHDYDLIGHELSSSRRYARLYKNPLYFLGGASVSYLLGIRARLFRPPRHWIPPLVGGLVGCTYSAWGSLSSIARFMRSLEDPDAVVQALQNVKHRSSHASNWDYGASPEPANPLPSWPVAPDKPNLSRSLPEIHNPAQHSTSRWDQIRAANVRHGHPAHPSSWDILRENHQRSQLATLEPSRRTPPP